MGPTAFLSSVSPSKSSNLKEVLETNPSPTQAGQKGEREEGQEEGEGRE